MFHFNIRYFSSTAHLPIHPSVVCRLLLLLLLLQLFPHAGIFFSLFFVVQLCFPLIVSTPMLVHTPLHYTTAVPSLVRPLFVTATVVVAALCEKWSFFILLPHVSVALFCCLLVFVLLFLFVCLYEDSK
jgi:hypothetical protein